MKLYLSTVTGPDVQTVYLFTFQLPEIDKTFLTSAKEVMFLPGFVSDPDHYLDILDPSNVILKTDNSKSYGRICAPLAEVSPSALVSYYNLAILENNIKSIIH